MAATNQGLRQASVRAVTGTTHPISGDWHALFDIAGIPAGPFNGRLLAWINERLGATYTEINGAMNAFAVAQGYTSWNAMGTFDAGGFTGILDRLSTASVLALSTARLLRTNYTGGAIRVRESGANVEADIGFDEDGLLDEAALTALTGANNGLVVSILDQSPAANTLVQATAARQPIIVSSGVVHEKNSRPALNFVASSSHRLALTGISTITTSALTVVIVGALDNAGGDSPRLLAFVKTGSVHDFNNVASGAIERYSSLQQFHAVRNSVGPPQINTTYGSLQRIVTVWNGSTVEQYSDTASPGTPLASTGNFEINQFYLGCGILSSARAFFYDGAIAECFVFPGVLSSGDLATLLADIDAFYGL